MQNVIEKAAVLVEVMPYIQQFRGDTIVVKFGGSIMADEQGVSRILRDVAFMACAGLKPVVVHGGGPAISRRMKEAGLKPEFRQGLRVTDEQTIRLVEQVMNHEVNPNIVSVLQSHGCHARGMHGDDLIHVKQHTARDPDSGRTVDWGYVGSVEEVDTAPVNAFLTSDITPVVTPLGRGADRCVYNVNADEAAAALAKSLRARKLVFLSDVPGLLADPNDPASLFSSVKASDVPGLIKRGVISGGMLPKIQGGIRSLEAGVRKTHIIDSNQPHSLLLELFTDEGIGTEIVHG